MLKANGFERLKSVLVAFVHKERGMIGVVHGDDFIWEGCDEDLDRALKVLQKYELKNRGRLGPGPNNVRKIDMLGRIIGYTDEGITWSGDPRHQKLLEDYFGMDDTTKVRDKKGYDKDGLSEQDDEIDDLTATECKAFRMLAARLNYMTQDYVWLQFSAKEICRSMANPKANDFMKIKRAVRFLKGIGGVKFKYKWQSEEEAPDITVHVDSDWAACRSTRRSTSGGVLKVGNHVLKTWSSTQPTIATSSGEAELIAMQDGAARGMGLHMVIIEMGLMPNLSLLRVLTDSSVAKSFVATRGLGKMRHLEVKLLWLQEVVQSGRLVVGKVKGTTNIADAMTKYHTAAKLEELCTPHGVVRAALTEATVGPRGVCGRYVPGGA